MTPTIEFSDLYKVMLSINLLQEHGGPDGHDGNLIKIWDDLQPDFQGEPYCAATDCYIWKHAGRPYPAIDHKWGFASCANAWRWSKQHDLFDDSGHYDPGDTTLWCFDRSGVPDHTGTLVWDNGHGILDFEGNTSPDGGFGSQRDGGGCYFRHRPHGSQLVGVVKSSRWLGQPKPAVVRPGKPAIPKQTPPKGVVAPTKPPVEVDMQILIKSHTDPAVFITDGVTKRHVTDQAELAVLINTGLVINKVSEVPPGVLANIPTVGASA